MKKKMMSLLSLGLMCIAFFPSCNVHDHDTEEQLSSLLEIPEKIISNSKAATLFTKDQQTRLTQIGKTTISLDEKAIHFDIIVLQKYVEHIEAIAVTKNLPITGVSFVFGATQHGKRTVFLMPSTRNVTLDYQESFTIENDEFVTFKHIEDYISLKNHSANDQNLVLSTDGFISFNEAATLFNQYQSQYIEPYKIKVTKEYYTKAVWYSLEEIKQYLTYVRQQSNKHKLAITGISVFFGVYDANPELELKSNAQTVFLTGNTQHASIINCKGKLLKEYLQNDFIPKNSNSNGDTDESLAFNMGHLSPPPKNN
ncbi:hypothetical protein EZY14_016950 [Kordia sp. TARA_039_SRF]|nr:hypothetical protein EZY14_016950 [Kordia sp. TARA_039_SRF]